MKQKTKVEIKTKIETKSIIYINLFKPPYVDRKTITYEKPYLQITIPFKNNNTILSEPKCKWRSM